MTSPMLLLGVHVQSAFGRRDPLSSVGRMLQAKQDAPTAGLHICSLTGRLRTSASLCCSGFLGLHFFLLEASQTKGILRD